MADNIKGITIKFDGDTTRLDKALKKVKTEAKGVDSELSEVNRLLKFNPRNTELLAQKMTLLKQKIDATGKEVTELKNIQKQMDAQGVDKNSEAYRKVQREIIEAESKLQHFKAEQQKLAAQSSRLGQLGTKFTDIGNKAEELGQSLNGVAIAAAAVAASIGAITYNAAANADELNTLSKQYGISTQNLQLYSAAAELVDVDMTTITKSVVKLVKSMNSAKGGTGSAAEAFKTLGVNVTDNNGNLRDANTVFMETIAALGDMKNTSERNAIALQLFGKSAMQLNPLILDAGETYKEVTRIFKENNLEIVDQEALDRANKFNDQIDIIKMTFKQATQMLGTNLASVLLPIMTKIQEAFSNIAGKIANMNPKVLAAVGAFGLLIAGLIKGLVVFGNTAKAIGWAFTYMSKMSVATGALGRAFTLLTGPLGIILAIFGLLFMSSDKFRKAIIGLVTEIGTAFLPLIKTGGNLLKQFVPILAKIISQLGDSLAPIIELLTPLLTMILTRTAKIATAILTVVTPAVKKLTGALSKIAPNISKALTGILSLGSRLAAFVKKVKSYFPINLGKLFNWHLSKLPQIRLVGGSKKILKALFGAASVAMPKFEWHAQGGIFTRPTLLSAPDGTIHGVGERGAEAILPLKELWKHIDGMGGITVNVYGSDNMSVTELAAAVEQRLIQMQKRRANAWR